MPVASLDDILAKVGQEVGISDWLTVDQAMIDAFADVTGDRQFIHVDPDAARATPFGGTIAHGFLTLSLLTRLAAGATFIPDTLRMAVNYGFDRVRFITPVRSGRRIRARFTLATATEKKPGQWQFVHDVTVEIEDEPRPALQAAWISLIFA